MERKVSQASRLWLSGVQNLSSELGPRLVKERCLMGRDTGGTPMLLLARSRSSRGCLKMERKVS